MQVVLTCRNRCSHTNTPRWDFSKTLNSSFPQFSMILLLQPCTVLCFRAQSLLSCSCCQRNFFWIRLVTQSFFSMAQYNKKKNIRLIKRFLLKLGVGEVRETQRQPQRVFYTHIPAWKLVPVCSSKCCLIVLCPDHIRVPSKPKYFLLLFEKLLLQSRETACVGCSLGTWPEAPVVQKMEINNIFPAQIQEY